VSSTTIGRVSVSVFPDTSDFRRQLRAQLEVIERSARAAVKVQADVSGAERDVAAFRKRVESNAARIKVNVDSGSFKRELSKMLGALAGVAKQGAVIGSIGLAMAGLAGSSLAAASNLAALSVSLASIAPVALALPGLLAGIGIGLGVTVAAFKDFGKVFPDVQDKLSQLQDTISTNFFSKAEAPIRSLIDTLFPQLAQGIATTATALGGFFGNLASSLTTAFDGKLVPLFGKLTDSINIAATGTGALAGIIATLGTLGASYLPRLATWFVEISTTFANFLSAAQADGRLVGWVDTGLAALRALGEVLFNVGSIFAGIGRAAAEAGGSSLQVFADALGRIAATVNSPAFQTMLTGVFVAAHEAMNTIATISGPALAGFFTTLGTTLTTVLPLAAQAIGTLVEAVASALSSPAFTGGLTAFFEGINTAVQKLAPALPAVGEALGSLLALFGDLAARVAPAVALALTGIATTVRVVADVLREHTGLVLGVVVPALAAWGVAATVNAAKNVAAWVSTALASTTSAKTQKLSAAQVVFSWVAKAAGATLNAAKVVASWVATGAAAVASAAVHAVQVAAQVAKWVVLATLGAAANAAKVVASWALTTASAIRAAAVHAAQVAVMVAKWIFMGTQALIQGARIAAAWLLALGPIGLVVAAVIAAVVLIVKNWDTIKRVVGTGVRAVIGYVSELPGKIKSLFGNAGTLLLDAGRKVIEGFISGITSAFGKVKETLGKLTDMLPDWKGPAKRDAVILKGAGKLVIGGFLDGMESQYGQVQRSLRGFTDDIGSNVVRAPDLAATFSGEFSEAGPQVVVNKHLHYTAAPGSSLGAEEDLFSAASRARMVGW
jgi:hypothetical protein